jgi:GNAT superfamily N-acetyltransferase
MTLPAWQEAPVARRHNRSTFDCGDAALNEFLKQHARRSHDVGGAKTFVAVDADAEILGFYSVSPASMAYARTPDVVKRGLARFDVPGFRLARLAVDIRYQGQGLGGQLLLAAARRCIAAATEVGGVMLLIDAKNADVARWYASYGAIALQDSALTLMLPLATAAAALKPR